MIYYFTPNRSDKNLGKACNDHCSIVPDSEDWICLMDQDIMFLNPHSAKLIEDVIEKYGSEYELFSCYTNRLKVEHQLPEGFDQEGDVRRNIEIANWYYNNYFSEVFEVKKGVAGLLMLFQKKTWERIKFKDGIIGVDWTFSNDVLRSGGKIGLMKGLYVYHLYRMFNKHSNIDHLR